METLMNYNPAVESAEVEFARLAEEEQRMLEKQARFSELTQFEDLLKKEEELKRNTNISTD